MRDSAIQDLLLTASKLFELDIYKPCRQQKYIEARAVVYSIMRECLNMTYKSIGKVFNKNHATILHAVNELPYMIKYKKELGHMKLDLLESWGSEFATYTQPKRLVKIKDLQERIFLLNLESRLLEKELKNLKEQAVQ